MQAGLRSADGPGTRAFVAKESKDRAAGRVGLVDVFRIILFVRLNAVDLNEWLLLDLVDVRDVKLLAVLADGVPLAVGAHHRGVVQGALLERGHQTALPRQLYFAFLVRERGALGLILGAEGLRVCSDDLISRSGRQLLRLFV